MAALKMKYTNLGSSGLRVSRICVGELLMTSDITNFLDRADLKKAVCLMVIHLVDSVGVAQTKSYAAHNSFSLIYIN